MSQLDGRVRERDMLEEALSTRLCPAVRARVLAHRFGVPWQHVSELCFFTGAAEALVFLDQNKRLEIEGDWRTAEFSFRSCGSPLEELFLAHCAESGGFRWTRSESAHVVGTWDCTPFSLFQQLTDAGARVDFAVTSPGGPRVAIELDGHDWHERTKHQAERDKSRDRRLQEIGWKVLRFTGSEIWRDPSKCVAEVLRIAGGE